MPELELLERLEDPRVKQVLNQNAWDELRYLIILYACTRLQPFNTSAIIFEGSQGLLRSTLRDFAQDEKVSRFAFPPKLQFEFFKGANKMLEHRLENELGYVRTFRKSSFTYYTLTDQGAKVARSGLAEAVKTADSHVETQTVLLPRAILDKILQDLQERVDAKQISENVSKELKKEYAELEALTSSPEAVVAEPLKIKLSQKTLTIGREQGCDISFPNDRFMSRKHAIVESSKGKHSIIDLHSKNGITRIENSKRVPVQREEIRPDEVYELGTTRLIFTS
jgi:hypothetical protein